jgi:murein DD-endopeptidase MepM/ murein hydrolase activator NlpD
MELARHFHQEPRLTIGQRQCLFLICGVVTVLCIIIYGFYGLAKKQAERLDPKIESAPQPSSSLNGNRPDGLAGHSSFEPMRLAHERHVGGPAWPLTAPAAFKVKARDAHHSLESQAEGAGLRDQVSVPTIWPVAGELTDRFGGRRNPFGRRSSEFHAGQDISAPTGTPVAATADGAVLFAGWKSGYGNLVIINHGDQLTTRYGHLSRIEVTAGQTIERRQQIGRVGSTGRSTGPHLHYEVRVDEQPVDPRRYLPSSAE